MISATAAARVQWTARCCQAGCANLVSAWPYCPCHGGWGQLHAARRSAPVVNASVELAGARGDFTEHRAAA